MIIEAIEQFFLEAFHPHFFWVIFVVAMFPLIELKGAIIFGQVLRAHISLFKIFLASYVGSLVVFPLIFICIRPLINRLKKTKLFCKIAGRLEAKLKSQGKKFAEEDTDADAGKSLSSETGGLKPGKKIRKKDIYKMIFIAVLVGVPIPGTGVWAGATVSVFIGLDLFKAFISTAIGNLISAGILILITELFGDYINWILFGFLILALLALLYFIYEVFIKKDKSKKLKNGAGNDSV